MTVLETLGVCTLLLLHVAARRLAALFGTALLVLWCFDKAPFWVWVAVAGGAVAVETVVELIGVAESMDAEKGFCEWVWRNLPW